MRWILAEFDFDSPKLLPCLPWVASCFGRNCGKVKIKMNTICFTLDLAEI